MKRLEDHNNRQASYKGAKWHMKSSHTCIVLNICLEIELGRFCSYIRAAPVPKTQMFSYQ